MNAKIKVYTMETCPDCIEAKHKLLDDQDYKFIDIGKDVKNLKEFLLLRDNRDEFKKIKEKGSIGIPCFVYLDGSISFEPPYKKETKTFCSLDGKGC